jgi:hypothetical protein
MLPSRSFPPFPIIQGKTNTQETNPVVDGVDQYSDGGLSPDLAENGDDLS